MLNTMTIRAKLITSAVLAVLIILSLAAVNFYSIQQGVSALASVYERQVLPAGSLQEIDSRMKEVRFRIAGVLLDQMPAVGSRNHLKDVRENVPKEWAEFKQKTKDNHFPNEAQELITKIEKNIATLPSFFTKLDEAYAAGGDKKLLGALLEDDWPAIQGGIIKPLEQLVPIQEAAVKATYEGSLASGRKLQTFAGGLAAVSLVIILGFTIQLIRGISRNIKEVSRVLGAVASGDLSVQASVKGRDELGKMADALNATLIRLRDIVSGVKQAADTVAASSARLSAEANEVLVRAESQSDGIMGISAAMEESSVSVTEVAHNASGVENGANHAQQIAHEGSAMMAKSIEATRRIEEAVASSTTTINSLSQSFDKVGEITRVIKDIAEQTNLLALNAAIEAARAGEQGRGFAVVADEVRKLAERTASSTADISSMLETIKGSSSAAVSAIGKIEHEVTTGADYNRSTGETLSRIVEAAAGVSESAHQIAEAVKEQSTASEDIASNMEKISSLTEQNNVSIREVDDAAKAMSVTASELQRLVGQFKVAA